MTCHPPQPHCRVSLKPFFSELLLSSRQTIIRPTHRRPWPIFSPCTLLDCIIHSSEMPYSARELKLGSSQSPLRWTNNCPLALGTHAGEPLGEVSGWHQPSGMCNEKRIKQHSVAWRDLACGHMGGAGSDLLMCQPTMNESVTLSQTSPPPGTKNRTLNYVRLRWDPPTIAGCWGAVAPYIVVSEGHHSSVRWTCIDRSFISSIIHYC